MKFNAQFPHNIRLKVSDLKETMTSKFLGLELDNHLNCKAHIEYNTLTMSSACYVLSSLSLIDETSNLKLHNTHTFILHKMKYELIVWETHLKMNTFLVYKRKLYR